MFVEQNCKSEIKGGYRERTVVQRTEPRAVTHHDQNWTTLGRSHRHWTAIRPSSRRMQGSWHSNTSRHVTLNNNQHSP